ncbi:MAG: hypothetical protein IJX17_05805 [Clostridia bacterium]|nr:hypothetical protein [Clostridia bacterium]
MNNRNNNFSNIDKNKKNLKDNYNNIDKNKYPINKSEGFGKKLPYHECYFDHTNLETHPHKKTGVCAEFRNVKYLETTIQNVDIRKILNFAIEHYLQYAPLKKVDVEDFISYVNKEFNVHILSIESVDLKRTLSLEQEGDDFKPTEPTQVLKNVNVAPKFKRVIEVEPLRTPNEISPLKTPVEMEPLKTPNEVSPLKTPVEMEQIKAPKEVRESKHIPEYEVEMGME